MRYSPKCENVRPLMITILLTVISVFSILFAGQFQSLKWLFQLSFLCFATAAIQIFMKYVLTKFEYVCDDTSLSIYKIMGRRSLCVGVIDLSLIDKEATKISGQAKYKELCEEFDTSNVLNFSRNLKATDIYGFSYNYNYTKILIKLEADETFISYLNKRISDSTKGKNEDDEF